MSTVYFCWVCDRPSDPQVPAIPHYEDKHRLVRFCSMDHQDEYRWLFRL